MRTDSRGGLGPLPPARPHRFRAVALYGVTFLIVTALSIGVALKVTPLQSVSALGETVKVGAAAPTFSLRGPGVLDLFGQTVPTTLQFPGPVRPRLVLSHISLNRQVAGFLEATERGHATKALAGRCRAVGFATLCGSP
jgi:hypothetical protein